MKIKCKVCGFEFEVKAENRYTGVEVMHGTLKDIKTYYNCFDCPECGCQYVAQKVLPMADADIGGGASEC